MWKGFKIAKNGNGYDIRGPCEGPIYNCTLFLLNAIIHGSSKSLCETPLSFCTDDLFIRIN
ncbi:uncharacterized protein PHALS_05980 [Plasmopara halstedii]|uniref:Uncharacterized protein n=1 Tax=Plasmopara halstedii TaxID=4781 RepID=A0A0P1ABJ7_PLAHL|nr:uncharacterized protein PHALS_05980 [Plasmopara halstedii]CEG37934.1 hypothetical protein PHALS_05980 [Plasmopara halstedii]|eukprot:XP_024574303.1 hypothetical protein PHALS_05980 [Plasmopara halstedii]